jgi:hypothetical protein
MAGGHRISAALAQLFRGVDSSFFYPAASGVIPAVFDRASFKTYSALRIRISGVLKEADLKRC